ncbi:hypothetical protein M899_2946 [Bacteriovorax sp. BSW11_IV]|uniref:hypothetical protein n=1 Tax=Bacteriovorax sp. BSW11_IV TaxID=1353529 RepID=UPI000389F868|nr:hypothetical protein [Bacteriovorax sp. BSW11_IV]EQC50121.1 hypothetical protein M899_2946 [Bacteriovorax sp. BSW11_IV]
MNLKRFSIVSDRDVQALEDTNEVILLNLDHIVSMKPINIVVDGDVREGFWIRMSNGKKYRALDIPKELKTMLKS